MGSETPDWLTSEGGDHRDRYPLPDSAASRTRYDARLAIPGNGSMEQQKQSATGVEMQRELFHLVAPKEPVSTEYY